MNYKMKKAICRVTGMSKDRVKQLGVAGLMVLGFTAAQAQAAVDAAITTAITTMAADGATVAGAVLVAFIGVVAIKFIRKGL